ncbi:hypothetical protein EVAR_62218_1 [Eumeta japonica]|uniref:Uncharacterized protein n=1 Tax=Eumeta variegata TaxID=151549 RepID=A0A4C1ZHZ5_EUMVA|nr:hypothetical protein EVAR_62218_1 [Eumeta japonica]
MPPLPPPPEKGNLKTSTCQVPYGEARAHRTTEPTLKPATRDDDRAVAALCVIVAQIFGRKRTCPSRRACVRNAHASFAC